ncbi:MAG: hypothetical protein GX451_02620 [Acholeplasmataceae bacterium]|nr:hypothetical protein [Acholeplasmataceae bacterium]
MQIELKLAVKVSIPTDDPEKAEELAQKVAEEQFPGFFYEGMSLGPELDYQMEEIKEMGRMWDDIMKSIFQAR